MPIQLRTDTRRLFRQAPMCRLENSLALRPGLLMRRLSSPHVLPGDPWLTRGLLVHPYLKGL